jgi:acyl-CoA thioesterase-1
LEALLAKQNADIVIVELGGNDGLRGLPLDDIRRNLTRIIELAKAGGAKVLLVPMKLPPNYGAVYASRFEAVYQELAEAHDLPLTPFLLDGVADKAELMQADNLHPSAAAQARLLDNVWPLLKPLL